MDGEGQRTGTNRPFGFDERYEAHQVFDAILAAGEPAPGWYNAILDTDAELPELAETPGGAPQPWRPAPSLVSYGASSTLTPGEVISPRELQPQNNRRMTQVKRETTQLMDRWQDNAMGATATDEANYANSTSEPGAGSMPGEAEKMTEESLMMEEPWYTTRAARIGFIAGAATLAAVGIAGGITAMVMRQRELSAARAMEQAIAASRVLRLTPAVARPDMLEATLAGTAASQHAQSAASEALRMARALGRAASTTTTAARDYAQDRTSAAQGAINSAYSVARGGASGAWQNFAKTTRPAPRWVVRIFNAGRYAGRMEQRLK